jgi:hypothetical protein
VSVPRREEVTRSGESVAQQAMDVPVGTDRSPSVARRKEPPRSAVEFSTEVRSGVRNLLSERCVDSVPSAVALRKRELRTSEWRTSVLRRCFAYPPASPKDTLAGVFERMKRAARAKKFARISERLAPRI